MCVCDSRINLPTQNITLINLNALSLACTKSSICSMQVGFLMSLEVLTVRELFDNVGYWWGKQEPLVLINRLRVQKRVIPENHLR